ncbi:FlgO family outer membrane protein [Congregibacter variabilis]|uniref:FlgO family outer membrane protein n=1 Tax=Congregibacter variabilis TaxID=3081200 RepID=A0ABZ0HZN0_9GAMM|nr:FlgO family outer membrane protein [Congregibacter sp. IMCC43200]
MRLIAELRQRRVFRGAGYYLLAAWGVLQVGDVIAEPAGLPPWSMTALLYILVLGFPIAMVLSWRYDIGEHGIVRTQLDSDDDSPPSPLKVVDYVLMLVLLGVGGTALYQLLPVAQQAEGSRSASQKTAMQDLPANSIAVLPFADISQSQDQGFLGDGISDTVMHVLSQIADLKVTARTSSFAFRNQNISVAEIAAALSVAHVLEGSVQKAGDQVRIIARLIDARVGSEIWSGYYDRTLESIFAIQDEIAREVSTALTTEVLKTGESPLIDDQYRPDFDAYEKFILGKQQLALRTTAGAQKAKELFQEATELDPDYALAYVYLAQAYVTASGREDRAATLESVSVVIAKALDLDPQLAEAHGAQAQWLLSMKRFPEAEASLKRALELRPSYADAYATYSTMYAMQGMTDESLAQMRKAIELDPQENRYKTGLAHALWSVSRSEEAIATVKEAIQRNPEVPGNYGILGRWYMQLGDIGKGTYWQDQAAKLNGMSESSNWGRCQNLVQFWAMERALVCTRDFLRQHPDDTEATQYLAMLEQDRDLAIRNLRDAVEENPNFWYRRFQLADWLNAAGDYEQVLEILKPVAPQLFTEEPRVTDMTIWAAVNVGRAYAGMGEADKATVILEAGLSYIERRRKLQGSGYVAGIEDAQFLLLLGRRDEALERLEQTVAAGWRFFSFGLTHDSLYDSLRNDPRFESVIAALKSDLQSQLAWYDANKDVPMESMNL